LIFVDTQILNTAFAGQLLFRVTSL